MKKGGPRHGGRMDRREFIRIVSAGSLLAANAGFLGRVWAGAKEGAKALVSVVNGKEPGEMIRKVLEPWGGMSYFVKEGARVVIKPNAAWERTPE